MEYLTLLAVLLLHTSVLGELSVTLPNGRIQGYERISPNDRTFHAFQGIPFAKPPLGELRFEAPVPPDNWEGVLEVTENSNRCYSVNKDTADESEDCLYINVFTPVLDTTTNATLLPVMVYFYGGGFRDGTYSYNIYGPDYLIEQDVVMVAPNYRVGPFGFLSTADDVIPGNVGLKDQLLALRWVQQNVHLFGGDPDMVTIFGQSAGAASVGMHIVSKASQGLFRGAIAESGSAVSSWAFIRDPVPYGYELASIIDGSVRLNSSAELLEYLRGVTAKQIDDASTKTTIIDHPLPVLEVEHEGAFLTENMYSSLERGDFNRVPLFIGANSEEYISLATDLDALTARMVIYDEYPSFLVPVSFNIDNTTNNIELLNKIGNDIKTIYIPEESLFVDNLGYSIAYLSENHFFNPCVRHAELQSNYTDVYFYKFSYAGAMGRNYNISLPGAEKCTHGEEMYYIFRRKQGDYDNSNLESFSVADLLTHERMVMFWTNFAKYLNPTPETWGLFQNLEWPKVKPDAFKYIDIAADLEIKTDVKEGRYLKWRDEFDKYAVKPLITF